MTVQELIFKGAGCINEHEAITEKQDITCACCNEQKEEGILAKKILGSNFTNLDSVRGDFFVLNVQIC